MTVHIRPRKILLILPVILALLTLAGCQKSLQQSIEGQEKVATETLQQQQNTDSIDTSDWQTYTNEEYGFTMQYPRDWEHHKSGTCCWKSIDFNKSSCITYEGDVCEDEFFSINIAKSKDELHTFSLWSNMIAQTCEKNIDLLDFAFTQKVIACEDNHMEYYWQKYYFQKNGLHYLFVIRYDEDGYHSLIGKKMLETFQFTDHEN